MSCPAAPRTHGLLSLVAIFGLTACDAAAPPSERHASDAGASTPDASEADASPPQGDLDAGVAPAPSDGGDGAAPVANADAGGSTASDAGGAQPPEPLHDVCGPVLPDGAAWRVQATVQGDPIELPLGQARARFSRTLNRLLLVGYDRTTLRLQVHITDPETGATVEVSALRGLSVGATALHPGGKLAALVVPGGIAVVDLETATVLHTWPAPEQGVLDVALGSDDRIYVAPRPPNKNGLVTSEPIYTIHALTGEVRSDPPSYSPETGRLLLHPGHTRLYVTRGGAPEPWDVVDGRVSLQLQLPHWQQTLDDCEAGWMDEDGAALVTKCGTVLHAGPSAWELGYAGSLMLGDPSRDLAHVDMLRAAHLVLASTHPFPVDSAAPRPLMFFDDTYFAALGEVDLPDVPAAPNPRHRPKYAFLERGGAAAYAIVEPLLNPGPTPVFRNDYLFHVRIERTAPAAPTYAEPSDVSFSAGRALGVRLRDAAYSASLDRVILAASEPDALYLVDPDGGTPTAISLPSTPYRLALDTTGQRAAVSHDGWVSIVDLAAGQITHELPTPTRGQDLVFVGAQQLYVAGGPDGWVWLDASSCTLALDQGPPEPQVSLTLAPSGDSIFSVLATSPGDVVQTLITKGRAGLFLDSPYHGDYPVGPVLWLSESGDRVFTSGGSVFEGSTHGAQSPLTFLGSFGGAHSADPIASGLHHAARHQLAVLRASGALAIYADDSYAELAVLDTPTFTEGASQHRAQGRHLFLRAGGTSLIALYAPAETERTDYAGLQVVP